MVVEIICKYPTQVVMGTAACIGALAYAGYSIYKKKKDDRNFKFDTKKLVDTIWQSAAAGAAAGLAIGCSWYGILTAMVTGIGVDKIANKFKISETEVLNLVQMGAKLVEKYDKKKK